MCNAGEYLDRYMISRTITQSVNIILEVSENDYPSKQIMIFKHQNSPTSESSNRLFEVIESRSYHWFDHTQDCSDHLAGRSRSCDIKMERS